MFHDILFIIWFFLPAAEANMAPVFAAKIPWIDKWTTPIDAGKKFRGKRIFGDHKTWRGIIAGIVLATLTLWIQQLCVAHFGWARTLTDQVDYGSFPLFVLGPLFGIGALGGDAIKSFFKRQRGIPSGKKWPPFDQLDFVIGSAIAVLPFVRLTVVEYIWVVVLGFGGHLLVSYLGYLLKLKDEPI